MKIGKKTSLIILLLFSAGSIIAIINLIGLGSIKNKTQNAINIAGTNLRYINKIMGNIYQSSNLTKDMIMSQDAGQRNNLLSEINMINGTAIFYGDSLKISMKKDEELNLFNNYLENQKKFLTSLTLINQNLNAGNTVGAINLNFSEFKSAAENYQSKMKTLYDYYQKQLDENLDSLKTVAGGIYFMQIILLILALIGAILSYLVYRTEYKINLQRLEEKRLNKEAGSL